MYTKMELFDSVRCLKDLNTPIKITNETIYVRQNYTTRCLPYTLLYLEVYGHNLRTTQLNVYLMYLSIKICAENSLKNAKFLIYLKTALSIDSLKLILPYCLIYFEIRLSQLNGWYHVSNYNTYKNINMLKQLNNILIFQ